jgi:hypothetical protein
MLTAIALVLAQSCVRLRCVEKWGWLLRKKSKRNSNCLSTPPRESIDGSQLKLPLCVKA